MQTVEANESGFLQLERMTVLAFIVRYDSFYYSLLFRYGLTA